MSFMFDYWTFLLPAVIVFVGLICAFRVSVGRAKRQRYSESGFIADSSHLQRVEPTFPEDKARDCAAQKCEELKPADEDFGVLESSITIGSSSFDQSDIPADLQEIEPNDGIQQMGITPADGPVAQSGQMWLLPGETLEVGGYSITSGWIYGGSLSNAGNKEFADEVSIIDLDLSVREEAQRDRFLTIPRRITNLSYQKLTPGERDTYLQWLDGGRNHSDVPDFVPRLFIAGVERRIIVDTEVHLVSGDEIAAIAEELLRLAGVFWGKKKIVKQLHALIGLCMAKNRFALSVVEELDLTDEAFSEWNRLELAGSETDGVLSASPQQVLTYILSTSTAQKKAVQSGYEADIELFSIRYREKFPNGPPVHDSGEVFNYRYRAQNKKVGENLELRFEGIKSLTSESWPHQQLIELWYKSQRDVSAHRRYLSKSLIDEHAPNLTALGLLPEELLRVNSRFKGLVDTLGEISSTEDCTVPVNTLMALAGDVVTTLPKKSARILAEICERAGFITVPDVRVHGIKPGINTSVYVLRKPDASLDRMYLGTYKLNVLMIRLSVLVSKSDDYVAPEESRAIDSLINGLSDLSDTEKRSLHCLSQWCYENKSAMAGVQNLLSGLTPEFRESIWNQLVMVAESDGKWRKAEKTKLDALYDILSLDQNQKANILNALGKVSKSDYDGADSITVEESETVVHLRDISAPSVKHEDQEAGRRDSWGAVLKTKRTSTNFAKSVVDDSLKKATNAELARDPSLGVFDGNRETDSDRTSLLTGSRIGSSYATDSQRKTSSIVSSLDFEKIKQLEQQQARTAKFLDDIFLSEDDEFEDDEFEDVDHLEEDRWDESDAAVLDTEGERPNNPESSSRLDALGSKHRKLLSKIRKQEQWVRSEFESMCHKQGLMADGALEAINEWAFNYSENLLIEADEEVVYLDFGTWEEINHE